jgi:hypothetical protein
VQFYQPWAKIVELQKDQSEESPVNPKCTVLLANFDLSYHLQVFQPAKKHPKGERSKFASDDFATKQDAQILICNISSPDLRLQFYKSSDNSLSNFSRQGAEGVSGNNYHYA